MASHLEFTQAFYDESWPIDEVTDQTEKLWRMLHAHPGLMNDFLYGEKDRESDHTQLDLHYPGWQFGEFAASVDRPSDSISKYLRLFNANEQMLNSTSKNVLTRVFAGNDFFATESIHALELMEGLLDGKKRRTGEAEICHIERGLLRLIVSAAKAQGGNREERHSFHVEKIPSLLIDAVKAGDERKQVDIAEVDQFIGEKTFNLRPFNNENLPITFAAIVAFIFHDFQEDFNSKGFSFHQNGNSLIIRHRENNTLEEVARFKFGAEYPYMAKIIKRMMDAYTRPAFKPGILTDDEDSEKQVQHLLQMLDFDIFFTPGV